LILGCASDDDSDAGLEIHQESGMLIDISKFEGCGWVFQYDNYILEPQNLSDFDITLTDSMPVDIRYYVLQDQKTTCKMGLVVCLVDIEKQ